MANGKKINFRYMKHINEKTYDYFSRKYNFVYATSIILKKISNQITKS
jgi:hypothetical protein